MADSAALRKRRQRKHADGDHSLCRPEHCEAVEEIPVLAPEPDVGVPRRQVTREVALGESGSALWRSVTASVELDPLRKALLLEACRMVDRLDALDRQLKGEDWLRFRHDESGAEVTVHIDRALAEAREQQTALKGIAVELAKVLPKPSDKPKGGSKLASVLNLVPPAPTG